MTTTNTISDYSTYANLQMLAEAIDIRVGNIPTQKGEWADIGNDRSSKTPLNIAEEMSEQGWAVAAHIKNTPTGLSATLFKNTSGEYVLSIRSTEFLDDSVRDAKVADDQEIRAGGFALGQLADLENWYRDTVSKLTAGQPITVTGYSLGGSLATAFEQLHRSEVSKVYTFNGAGVGRVNEGHTLTEVLTRFTANRSPDNDLSGMFTTPAVRDMYAQLRARLRDGGPGSMVTDQDINAARALGQSTVVRGTQGQVIYQTQVSPDGALLLNALVRIKEIQDEVKHVAQVTDTKSASPHQVDYASIEATNLNYQLAFLDATKLTTGVTTGSSIVNAWQNYGPRDELRANITDVMGQSRWSAVSRTGQLSNIIKKPGFSDMITGTLKIDRITGLGGNDALDGQGGNDQIDGGEEDDLIGGDGQQGSGGRFAPLRSSAVRGTMPHNPLNRVTAGRLRSANVYASAPAARVGHSNAWQGQRLAA
jgi:hypothetical protein